MHRFYYVYIPQIILFTSWDEWVPENRVLKYNEANVQRQKDVFKQHSSTAGKNKKGLFRIWRFSMSG